MMSNASRCRYALVQICPACWRKAGLSVFKASNSASMLVPFPQCSQWQSKDFYAVLSFNQPQPNAISHLIPTNSTGIPYMFSSAASLDCSPSSVSLQRCSVRGYGFFKNGPFPSSWRKQCIHKSMRWACKEQVPNVSKCLDISLQYSASASRTAMLPQKPSKKRMF